MKKKTTMGIILALAIIIPQYNIAIASTELSEAWQPYADAYEEKYSGCNYCHQTLGTGLTGRPYSFTMRLDPNGKSLSNPPYIQITEYSDQYYASPTGKSIRSATTTTSIPNEMQDIVFSFSTTTEPQNWFYFDETKYYKVSLYALFTVGGNMPQFYGTTAHDYENGSSTTLTSLNDLTFQMYVNPVSDITDSRIIQISTPYPKTTYSTTTGNLDIVFTYYWNSTDDADYSKILMELYNFENATASIQTMTTSLTGGIGGYSGQFTGVENGTNILTLYFYNELTGDKIYGDSSTFIFNSSGLTFQPEELPDGKFISIALNKVKTKSIFGYLYQLSSIWDTVQGTATTTITDISVPYDLGGSMTGNVKIVDWDYATTFTDDENIEPYLTLFFKYFAWLSFAFWLIGYIHKNLESIS